MNYGLSIDKAFSLKPIFFIFTWFFGSSYLFNYISQTLYSPLCLISA